MYSKKKSFYKYSRRRSVEVAFGEIKLGGFNPIRIESMTNTNTRDIDASVRQCVELHEAGCDIIRLAVPSIKDVEALGHISKALRNQGIKRPLVADIHFNPHAAIKAAEFVENIRINPGNYADKKKFEVISYTDSDYEAELERIHIAFKPLILKAKEYGCSMRIGVNHGSLSDRIMNRYGDTPLGMVESALEFARFCAIYDYHEIVFSMKSSIPQVMIQAYRLLVNKLSDEDMKPYPLHLGVTEAGGGEEARVKSSIGIGSLLEDGLGDTVRVSLTEDPVHEIPVCQEIVKKYNDRLVIFGERCFESANSVLQEDASELSEAIPFQPYEYSRRTSNHISLGSLEIGGLNTLRVETTIAGSSKDANDKKALNILLNEMTFSTKPYLYDDESSKIEIYNFRINVKNDLDIFQNLNLENVVSLTLDNPTLVFEIERRKINVVKVRFLIKQSTEFDKEIFSTRLVHSEDVCKEFCFVKEEIADEDVAKILVAFAKRCESQHVKNVMFSVNAKKEIVHVYRRLWMEFEKERIDSPILLYYRVPREWSECAVIVHASIQLGSLLSDGLGDAVLLETDIPRENELNLVYNILQGTRRRITKTEFISCPSCGRTLFDIETTANEIKSKIAHLKELRIAVMGCIVNGPGEMADADFGYVGTGIGRISLYVGKTCVEKDIPQEEALERLVELIKKHGKWRETFQVTTEIG